MTDKLLKPRFYNMDPLPGTTEAVKAGCTCPTSANHNGKGAFPDIMAHKEAKLYYVDNKCIVHNKPYGDIQ